MRKSLLIVITIAVLGGLGLYINKGSDNQVAMADAGSSNNAPAVKTAVSTDTSSQATQTPTSSASQTTAPAPPTSSSGQYKDGTYTGSQASTIYGTVQVAAVISGGKITNIQFLKMPDDQENSKVVTAMAEPGLKSQAISKQSAKIDFVSGATQTSEGFEQSLQNALNQAA